MRTVHEIVTMDNVEALKSVLQHDGVDINAFKRSSGATALMLAGWHGREACARLLIAHGADVNLQNENGDTAISFAIRRGHANVVRLLIDSGANLNRKNKNGQTPADLAKEKDHLIIEQILQQAQETSVCGKQRRLNEMARKMKRPGGPP